MLYVDTSLLVAAVTNEQRTAEIQQWLAAQSPEELTISDWVITEFSAALSMKVRRGHLDPTQRADVLAQFTAMAEASFTTLNVSSLDFRTAARLADQHATGLRAGDALHLAIAANHGLRFCALDRSLVSAAQSLGVSSVLL